MSAYRSLKRGAAWERIRAAALTVSGGRCSICGDIPGQNLKPDPRLYCHEVWHYDDPKAVAMLEGFRMLCADCNGVTHMGRSAVLGYLDQAVAHLARVNRISEGGARRIFHQAIGAWEERNQKTWSIEVSQNVIAEYPELKILTRPHRDWA